MLRSVCIIGCVIFLAAMMTGCFGYVSIMPAVCNNETPSTDVRVVEEQGKPPSPRPQKADFLELWGEPNLIEKKSANTEVWTYKRNLWCGGIPVFFIPVPLLLPVCDGYEKIEFRNNVATSLQTRKIVKRGAIVGMGPLYENEQACRYPLSDTPNVEKQAKEMTAPPDMALVYYYRTGPYRPALGSHNKLYIDGQCSGESLRSPAFYVFTLSPGTHIFESHGSKVTLDAAGGETYFIKEEGHFFSLNPDVSLVDAAVGRKGIRFSRLVKIDAANPCDRTVRPSGSDIKNAAVPEGKAIVYLYLKNIDDDDYHIAFMHLDDGSDRKLTAGTFLPWQMTPGIHTIGSGGESVTLTAQAGVKYYVRVEAYRGFLGNWRHPMRLVDQEEGRRDLEVLSLME